MAGDSNLDDILNALIYKKEVIFKSQQRDEPELTDAQKKDIASKIFEGSKSRFLSRFGKNLREGDLKFFEETKPSSDLEDYEVKFHLESLKRHFGRHRLEVKNRRYAALKKMKEESGGYFSETEMMRRNPLLYDQLVGQFLTEEEKKSRDGIDTQNITFVNLLLESIDRKACKEKQSEQQNLEDSFQDDSSSSPPDSMNVDPNVSDPEEDVVDKTTQWGEYPDQATPSSSNPPKSKKRRPHPQILLPERRLLHEEFCSLMYESFISGKDKDFDYASVDDNEEYDNLEIKNHDAEESYFDSESPEEVAMVDVSKDGDVRMVDSEGDGDVVLEGEKDELDVFMERLHQQGTIQDLAKRVHNM